MQIRVKNCLKIYMAETIIFAAYSSGLFQKKTPGGGGGDSIFLRPSGVKFPIRSLPLVKLRVWHVKCILSFREDETKVKIQMVDLFRRKPDVYIRLLQVRTSISAINSPTPQRLVCGASSGLRGCRRRRSSKIRGRIQTLNTTFLLTSMPVFGSKFAVQIKCHSKTLDHFKERRRGWWGRVIRDWVRHKANWNNKASAERIIWT